MNRNISIILYLLFGTILMDCTGCIPKNIPNRTKATATTGVTAKKEPALSHQGRQLAATKCTNCHQFYGPEAYTKKQWASILQWKSRRLSLNPDEMEALSSYFLEGGT